MSDKTKISWTDTTWSAIVGCTRASTGCEKCYSERFMARFSGVKGHKFEGLSKFTPEGPRWTGEVRFAEKALLEPLSWRKPRRVFVCSISDLFHEKAEQEWIDRIFAVMAMTPQHTYQVLTKRAERMRDYVRHPDAAQRVSQEIAKIETGSKPASVSRYLRVEWPLPNIWMGTSCENQEMLEMRYPFIVDTLAAVRWISAEPLLSGLDLDEAAYKSGRLPESEGLGISWIVAGSESGPGARPMDLDWVRSLRDQSVRSGVAFFFKQKMEGRKKIELPELDGKVWNEYPKEAVEA